MGDGGGRGDRGSQVDASYARYLEVLAERNRLAKQLAEGDAAAQEKAQREASFSTLFSGANRDGPKRSLPVKALPIGAVTPVSSGRTRRRTPKSGGRARRTWGEPVADVKPVKEMAGTRSLLASTPPPADRRRGDDRAVATEGRNRHARRRPRDTGGAWRRGGSELDLMGLRRAVGTPETPGDLRHDRSSASDPGLGGVSAGTPVPTGGGEPPGSATTTGRRRRRKRRQWQKASILIPTDDGTTVRSSVSATPRSQLISAIRQLDMDEAAAGADSPHENPDRRQPDRNEAVDAPVADGQTELEARLAALPPSRREVLLGVLAKLEGEDGGEEEEEEESDGRALLVNDPRSERAAGDGAHSATPPQAAPFLLRERVACTELRLRIRSTHGSPTRVGLAGLALFDAAGAQLPLQPDQIEVRGDPTDVSVRRLASAELTIDDQEMWLRFVGEGARISLPVEVVVSVPRGTDVAAVAIHNYNKSLAASTQCAREVDIYRDGDLVWTGSLARGSGNAVFDTSTIAELNRLPLLYDDRPVGGGQAWADHSSPASRSAGGSPERNPGLPAVSPTTLAGDDASQGSPLSRRGEAFSDTVFDGSTGGGELSRSRKSLGTGSGDGSREGPQRGAGEFSDLDSLMSARSSYSADSGRNPFRTLARPHRHRHDSSRSESDGGGRVGARGRGSGSIASGSSTSTSSDGLDDGRRSGSSFASPGRRRLRESREGYSLERSRSGAFPFPGRDMSSTTLGEHSATATPDDRRRTGEVGVGFRVDAVLSGQSVRLRFTRNWGDPFYMGLTGLAVLDPAGGLIDVGGVRARPSSINILPNVAGDDRTPDKLVDGVTLTADDHHMWMIPYTPGEDHVVTLDLGVRRAVAGLIVWNYNGSREAAGRGVLAMHVTVDGARASPPAGFLVRRAPGNALVDFGQTFALTTAAVDPRTLCRDGAVVAANDVRPRVAHVTRGRDTVYLTPLRPVVYSLRIAIYSTLGDCHYVGLDGLEVTDSDGNVVDTELRVSSTPHSVGGGDPRTPSKLLNGEVGDDVAAWLVPYDREHPPEIFLLFERPIILGTIAFWNYSKDPSRGVMEFSVFGDSLLLFQGALGPATAEDEADSDDGGVGGRAPQLVSFTESAFAEVTTLAGRRGTARLVDEGHVLDDGFDEAPVHGRAGEGRPQTRAGSRQRTSHDRDHGRVLEAA